jgi:hypothetical protein
MASRELRMAFGAFHITLGAVVLFQSVATFLTALNPPEGVTLHPHTAILAGVEALGAILFLIGRTLKLGGALMLLTFAIALAVHRFGQPALLVYAAGTIFVMMHGSLWPKAALDSGRQGT